MPAAKSVPINSLDMRSEPLSTVMQTTVISIDMDATVGTAMELCTNRRIRHLPVLDEGRKLVGLLTDRDLRACISPRIGTLSENNADRETLHRHIHVVMTRQVVTAPPTMTLSQAAALMLERKVGCLPVVYDDGSLAGIVTTTDFLRVIAQYERKRAAN
jgi:acetoin utilization protein AcuB